jgi:hypothetical protein
MSFLHVGAVNSGRKAAKTSIMGLGKGMNFLLSKISLSFAFILPQEEAFIPPSFPPFLYKVELRGCLKSTHLGNVVWPLRPIE